MWRLLVDGVSGDAALVDTLAAGATRTFRWMWDQRDARGRPVAPGAYCVVGALLQFPYEVGPPPPARLIIDP